MQDFDEKEKNEILEPLTRKLSKVDAKSMENIKAQLGKLDKTFKQKNNEFFMTNQ